MGDLLSLQTVVPVRLSNFILGTLLLVLVAFPAAANVELVLTDGQVLKGIDVRRDKDMYLLETETGDVMSIPTSLVKNVKLLGDKPKTLAGESWDEETRKRMGPSGVQSAEPEVLAGYPDDEETRKKMGPSHLITDAKPEVLAGEEIRPPSTREQLEVFGESAKFQQGWNNPNWTPESAFEDTGDQLGVMADSRSKFQQGTIDPNWTPESAYDADVDVLEPGHSNWSDAGMDNSWQPEDGFKKRKTAYHPGGAALVSSGVGGNERIQLGYQRNEPATRTSSLAGVWTSLVRDCKYCGGSARRLVTAPAPPPTGPSLASCAREVLRSDDTQKEIALQLLEGERYDVLPVPVYEASDGERRALFTVSPQGCRILGGDLAELLGVRLSPQQAATYAATEFRAALAELGVTDVAAERKIEYAFAIAGLIDPRLGAAPDAELVLLRDADQLRVISDNEGSGCAVKKGKRRKVSRRALDAFRPPAVERGAGGELITFQTWCEIDGVVIRHAIWLADDGAVAVTQETAAEHVGSHREPSPAPDQRAAR